MEINSDLKNLQIEIEDIVDQETRKLEDHLRNLARVEAENPSELNRGILSHAKALTLGAIAQLDNLREFVYSNKDETYIFNETIKLAGFSFRNSVAARTSLLRHTPTLKGNPETLDPDQNHILNPGEHTVEYGRGGYHLYQATEKNPPITFVDHPVLGSVAQSIKEKIYGDTDLRAILFTCGLGAINTFLDYIRSVSGDKDNVVGQSCWIEVKKYVSENYLDKFAYIDDMNGDQIINAIRDRNVLSVTLETLINHPHTPVTDIDQVMRAVKETKFEEPKILFVDNVHNPEFNIMHKYFKEGIPENLCFASVMSGVKFLQAGWDISKSGVLFLGFNEQDYTPGKDPYTRIIEIRGGSGRVPSTEEAYLADIETERSFRSRLTRYDRNTRILANILDTGMKSRKIGYASSPWLENHKYHDTAMRNYGSGGRLIYLFFNPERISQTELYRMYRDVAETMYGGEAYLMASSSFGMAAPHSHLVMHPEIGPTIRVSPGSTNLKTVYKLGSLFLGMFDKYVERKGK